MKKTWTCPNCKQKQTTLAHTQLVEAVYVYTLDGQEYDRQDDADASESRYFCRECDYELDESDQTKLEIY